MARLPKVIDDFVRVMGQALLHGADLAATEEERERFEADQRRIQRETDQYVQSSALGLAGGRRQRLGETQRKSILTRMNRSLEAGETTYRELYTSLTEDPEFTAYAENEVYDEGPAGAAQRAAREGPGKTVNQRTRLAEQIIDKDISRRVRLGTAENEEIIAYEGRLKEEIGRMDDDIKALETKLEEANNLTAEERAEASRWHNQYQKTLKEY